MRITSEGPGGRLGASTIPVPARLGQGYQSWGQVVGMPGDTAIPAPAPAGVYQDRSHRALHRSCDAPPVWTPGVYYQPHLASRFHGALDSDNQMPVPAVAPQYTPYIAARRATQLRQLQVGWPATTPSYRWRG